MNRLDDDGTKRIDDGNKKIDDGSGGGQKKIGGMQRHQSINETSCNNHVYTSGAGHHHSDNSTPPTYDRANNSQNSGTNIFYHFPNFAFLFIQNRI